MDLIYRFHPTREVDESRPDNAPAAIDALLTGNARLARLVQQVQRAASRRAVVSSQAVVPLELHLGLPCQGVPRNQLPYAMVLGCSDARVPVEWVFDQGFNDLFVVRGAGNVVGTDSVGSFHYAARHLPSVQVAVVLGHTCCGAVTAAVDAFLRPDEYERIAFSNALQLLVDALMVSVHAAAAALADRFGADVGGRPGYRAALIDAAVYMNAAVTAFDLQRELTAHGDHRVSVVYGVCDLRSMLVTSLPAGGEHATPDLAHAVDSVEEFGEVAAQIVAAIKMG